MTLHNPWGIKLSAKDISQGWRFCFVEELMVARPMDAKFKSKGQPAWSDSPNAGFPCTQLNIDSCTYITRTPVPNPLKLPPILPLKKVAEPDELDVLTEFLGSE